MDNAALSGRLAVKAIIKAEEEGLEATRIYGNLMRKAVNRLEVNMKKKVERFSSDTELEKNLSLINMLKGWLYMLIANQINRILPPEKLIFLPP